MGQVGTSVALLGALTLCSCSATPRGNSELDAGAGSNCGNGRIDPVRLGPDVWGEEQCDDGENTGSEQSLCSKQCISGAVSFPSYRRIRLSHTPVSSVMVRFPDEAAPGLLYVDAEATFIRVVKTVSGTVLSGSEPPNEISIPAIGQVVAVSAARVDTGFFAPIWIERHLDRTFHLYAMEWPSSGVPVAHEVLYPLSNGTSPRMAAMRSFDALAIVDVDAGTGEIQVATVRISRDWVAASSSRRLSAAGRSLGHLAENSMSNVNDPAVSYTQLVQFFEDTGSFVSIEIRDSSQIMEVARGSFPTKVLSSARWDGLAVCYPALPAEDQWPYPIAVLDQLGDIYVSQFRGDLTPDEFYVPFAHVQPGSSAMNEYSKDVAGLYVLEASGQRVVLTLSDCGNLRARTLLPQRAPIPGGPFTSATIPDEDQIGGGGEIVDDYFYLWD